MGRGDKQVSMDYSEKIVEAKNGEKQMV